MLICCLIKQSPLIRCSRRQIGTKPSDTGTAFTLAEWHAKRTFASVARLYEEWYYSLVGTVNESYLLQLSVALYTFGCSRSARSAGVPCQIIPHPLAQSASAPGSRKMFYDSLFSTLRVAALIEWETEIWQAGEAVFSI